VQFLELQKHSDFDLGLAQSHTGVHIRSRSTHTPNYTEIGKTSWTDGHTWVPFLGHHRLAMIICLVTSEKWKW